MSWLDGDSVPKPIPGSSEETRARAIEAIKELIDQLREGETVTRDELMEAGGLPKDNRSDRFFLSRWLINNRKLESKPRDETPLEDRDPWSLGGYQDDE